MDRDRDRNHDGASAQAAGAPAGPEPALPADLTGHWDANIGVTNTSGKISEWENQGSHVDDWIQDGAAARPAILVADGDGNVWLNFADAGDHLFNNSLSLHDLTGGQAQGWMAMVLKAAAFGTAADLWRDSGAYDARTVGIRTVDATGAKFRLRHGTTDTDSAGTTGLHVIQWKKDATKAYMRVDDGAWVEQTAGNMANNLLLLGHFSVAAVHHLSLSLWRASALSDAEELSLFAYLNDRYSGFDLAVA